MVVAQIINIGEVPKRRTKDVQENVSISRRITDENRAKSVHELRKEVRGKLETLDFLAKDYRIILELIVGEAMTNACCHMSNKKPIKVNWKSSDSIFELNIINPSKNCHSCHATLPEDNLSEHGRGLFLIEGLVNQLASEAKLRIGCRLQSSLNQTVFSIAICR